MGNILLCKEGGALRSTGGWVLINKAGSEEQGERRAGAQPIDYRSPVQEGNRSRIDGRYKQLHPQMGPCHVILNIA